MLGICRLPGQHPDAHMSSIELSTGVLLHQECHVRCLTTGAWSQHPSHAAMAYQSSATSADTPLSMRPVAGEDIVVV